jgi:hypothetical protein
MTATSPAAATLAADFQRLEDVLDVYGDEAPGTFEVQTLEQAEWAGTKLRAAAERIAARKAVRDERLRILDEWLVDANAADLQSIEYMEGLLEHFHRGQRTADPKKNKSVKLPGVTLKSTESTKWKWDDEAATIAWAKEHAEGLLRFPDPELDKAKAKKVLEVKGTTATFGQQVVPGITIEKGVTFDTKLG